MTTRFDKTDIWRCGKGVDIPISSMETNHLINTIRMLVDKPSLVVLMLISDIEHSAADIWHADVFESAEKTKRSINNATSMTPNDVREWVMDTPLYASMTAELERRGVNVVSILGFDRED